MTDFPWTDFPAVCETSGAQGENGQFTPWAQVWADMVRTALQLLPWAFFREWLSAVGEGSDLERCYKGHHMLSAFKQKAMMTRKSES